MGPRADATRDPQAAAARSAFFARLIAAVLVVVAGFGAWTQWRAPRPLVDAGDATLVDTGEGLYATYCASCHGARLEGQPDWRLRRPDGRLPAPPHDASGHTWHHPDEMLIGMVREGFQTGKYAPPGYTSDMPAYGSVLDDTQIRGVLAYIKSTWPEKARAHQARISRQAEQR